MFIFLAIILSSLSFAQIDLPVNPIDYDQNPSRIEWKTIDTVHFQLIFPAEVTPQAQRVAHLLEKAYPFVSRSLETLPPKIPIVLQNQSVISNGFVTLAPRRSEWYMSPSNDPELSNNEWLKTLSIHEFRHVVQFHKTKRGFNNILYIVLGEIGQAIGLGLSLPPWFLEGDAVGVETALTRGGRGRLPQFDRDLRTILLSGKTYDYDKTHLRSYKDYIPNHYVFGYFYTSYLRNKYGDLALSQIADASASNSYNPLTYYNAQARLTGISFEDFYANVMKDLLKEWKERADKLSPTPYEVRSLAKKRGWTNYLYPQITEKGKIVALKKGLSHIDQFVEITKGKEEKVLFYPAPLVGEYPYKIRKDRLAYLEMDIDPRWGYRNFSRLKVYDLKDKKFILNRPKTKFRSAVLNPEGTKLLMVEWNEKQGQTIVIMDVKSEAQDRYHYPTERIITSVDWLNDKEIVMVVLDHQDMKSLVKFSLEHHPEENLIPPALNNIGFVTVEENHIFYESPESGIDNIFLFSKEGKRQITSSLFGAYAPEMWKGKLYYNDYTVDGMNVVRKSLAWEEAQTSGPSFFPVYEKFVQSEGFELLEKKYAEVDNVEVKNYSQMGNAVNLHSWLLLAPPLSSSIVVQGFSRDILNKFTLTAGASYNFNEQTPQVFTGAVWSHLYPVFDIRGAYGSRSQDITRSGRKIHNRWEEGTAEAGIQVPWKALSGRFGQFFTTRAFAKVIKVTNKISNDLRDVNDGALLSPGAEMSFSYTSRLAPRDLYPEWGTVLNGHFEEGKDVTGVNQRGSLASFDSRWFLPGFTKHHSFFHQLAYEKQRDRFYQYQSFIFYPRGTRSVFLREMTKYSANYSFPLLTPDWHWSRYVYLKRLSMNLFYDELHGHYRTAKYSAGSYGWEGLFETHFLRIFLPITFGVRGSYVLHGREKTNSYEVFLQQALGVF